MHWAAHVSIRRRVIQADKSTVLAHQGEMKVKQSAVGCFFASNLNLRDRHRKDAFVERGRPPDGERPIGKSVSSGEELVNYCLFRNVVDALGSHFGFLKASVYDADNKKHVRGKSLISLIW